MLFTVWACVASGRMCAGQMSQNNAMIEDLRARGDLKSVPLAGNVRHTRYNIGVQHIEDLCQVHNPPLHLLAALLHLAFKA